MTQPDDGPFIILNLGINLLFPLSDVSIFLSTSLESTLIEFLFDEFLFAEFLFGDFLVNFFLKDILLIVILLYSIKYIDIFLFYTIFNQ